MTDRSDKKEAGDKPPAEDKKPEAEGKKNWWTTLPGILAQLAVLITAIAGLVVALNNAGIILPRPTNTPTPTLTGTPTRTSTPTPIPTQTITPTETNTPAPTQTATPTTPPTLTLRPTSTITPTPTMTPVIATKLELCVRQLGDRAIVREGPDTTTAVRGRLPVEACLIFDLRLPDSSWVRIAQEQRDPTKHPFALGWVKSELLSEASEIEHLNPYFGEDVRDGYYCVNTGSGVNVRDCADISCRQSAILSWKECLLFDSRLADSSWLRIALEQEDKKYTAITGKWISTENRSIILREFQSYVYPHDMLPYFELLPVVTPPPTPEG